MNSIMLLFVLSLTLSTQFSSVFFTAALHQVMNDDELVYYFQTKDRETITDYELVDLPVVVPVKEAFNSFGDEVEEIDYKFSAFQRMSITSFDVLVVEFRKTVTDRPDLLQGLAFSPQELLLITLRPIDLKLRRNSDITIPSLKTYIHDEDGIEILNQTPQECHYLHVDEKIVASISICSPKNVQGFIFLENSTLEIQPLTHRLRSILKLKEPLLEYLEAEETVPHLVKRAKLLSELPIEAFPLAETLRSESYHADRVNETGNAQEAVNYNSGKGLTLEVALFFDEAAYRIFAPYFNYDKSKLQDMLLAYMNGVQALYHHPSLGTSLELTLVRLDIMVRQASGMPHYQGERSKLLDSFCAYQKSQNPRDDSNPEHWDMALYVSGLDFFAYENGRKSTVTMGLATVAGVCSDIYQCIIAEFGTNNMFGKPYPSAGFTSVYILAHEIGHNLGMHHDSTGNSCPKEGYIMSPSRGTNGETQWSTCSAKVMSELGWAKCLRDSSKPQPHLDHNRFLDNPGITYTAKKQCELLLRDRDATVLANQEPSTYCYNLQCQTLRRSGYYFAGPALEGTECGKGQYCYGGNCIRKNRPKPVKVIPGGWGPWKEGSCRSGCLEKSVGKVIKKRLCNNPAPVNTDRGCNGASTDMALCSDNKVCKSKRMNVVDYASERCEAFSKLLPELERPGSGLQSTHEPGRLWMGCAIFCKSARSNTFYSPRIELNDLGLSPYFPDGTWCHKVNNINYYCIQHNCVPENFKFTKSSEYLDDLIFLQNAMPSFIIPQSVKDYLSISPDGKPISTTLKDTGLGHMKDEEWETKDYIEVPGLANRL